MAQASTFCVNKSGPQCTQVDPDVQTALGHASANAGADTVEIGPGTYTRTGGFSYSNGDVLHVVGSGAGATTLTADTGVSTVLSVAAGPNSTVGSLGVRIPATASSATGIGATTSGPVSFGDQALAVDGVSVTADPAAVAPVGVSLDGATLAHATVDLPNVVTGNGTAVRIVSGSSGDADELSLSTLKAHTGVQSTFGSITNVDITANVGVHALSTTNCTSCLIRVIGANGIGTHADTSAQGINLSVNNDTIVGDGSAGSIGVFFDGAANGGNLFMTNSIVRGTATSIKAENADLSNSDYNDYPFASVIGVTPAAHDIDIDPHFVNATSSPADPAADYRLRFDSPVIDHGSPNFSQLPPDLDGNPRPGGTATDLGAYEYVAGAPSVTASASSAGPLLADFTANGTDPNHGDPLTYTWAFDDGATAVGQNVQHAFSTPGSHSATVTVHDPTGLTASASTTVAVANPPVGLPAISNLFKFGTTRLNAKRGWVILRLNLPGPGRVKVVGTATSPANRVAAAKRAKSFTAVRRIVDVKRAGLIAITLKPGKKAARILRRKLRLKVPLKITYTPTGGSARVRNKTVIFKLQKPKKG